MVQTNYTTYDQAYYYADLNRIPRLTDEERKDLLTRFSRKRSQNGITREQQQLIESYLPLAKCLAIELCPKSAYHRCLPDLIGTANLALVEIVKSRDLTTIQDLTSYLAAYLRRAIKAALLSDNPIKLYWYAYARLKAQGLDHVLNVASLDASMHWDESDEQEEPYTTPITPNTPTPERNPIKCAQVEEYLSYLPLRTQTILRLRYGLLDEDERAYSVIEIAGLLGLTRGVVNAAIHHSMDRLRALAEGKATIARHKGRTCISYSALPPCPVPTT